MQDKVQKYIKEGIKVLKEGGVVIFPTDTAFGIGCRIDNEEAIKKVFSIRKRPTSQAVPVLVSGISMARDYVDAITPAIKERLIDAYWPGGLTIVLPAKLDRVPSLARGGGLTVGVRAPDHLTTQSLIKRLDMPIIGPSANFHGNPTPYQLSDVDPELFHLVDYLIPGVCTLKIESTVIDASVTPWKVLRQGAVTLDESSKIKNKR